MQLRTFTHSFHKSLALVISPPIGAALNKIAVHLFLVYYSLLAGITLPVAIAAFLASSIAQASPMCTAWVAMRLGIVIYFIPFFSSLIPLLL